MTRDNGDWSVPDVTGAFRVVLTPPNSEGNISISLFGDGTVCGVLQNIPAWRLPQAVDCARQHPGIEQHIELLSGGSVRVTFRTSQFFALRLQGTPAIQPAILTDLEFTELLNRFVAAFPAAPPLEEDPLPLPPAYHPDAAAPTAEDENALE